MLGHFSALDPSLPTDTSVPKILHIILLKIYTDKPLNFRWRNIFLNVKEPAACREISLHL